MQKETEAFFKWAELQKDLGDMTIDEICQRYTEQKKVETPQEAIDCMLDSQKKMLEADFGGKIMGCKKCNSMYIGLTEKEVWECTQCHTINP